LAHDKLRRQISCLAGAAGATWLLAASASAVVPDSVILGGQYRVSTTQGSDAGVIYMARSGPRMLIGSGIHVEYACKHQGAYLDEILLEGVTVAPSGHFALRWVTRFGNGGGNASVQRIDGTFITRRLARGRIWGWSGSSKDCVISSKHPVHFRARYTGPHKPT